MKPFSRGTRVRDTILIRFIRRHEGFRLLVHFLLLAALPFSLLPPALGVNLETYWDGADTIQFEDWNENGVLDTEELWWVYDTTDSDGDGMSDNRETVWGTYTYIPDSDGDGITDGDEVDLLGGPNAGYDPQDWDTNDNGYSDHDEAYGYYEVDYSYHGPGHSYFDWDGDGVKNIEDSNPFDSVLWNDWNGNGTNDHEEDPEDPGDPYDPTVTDSDGDGVYDSDDSHPNDPYRWDDWNDNGINDGEEDPGGPVGDADGDGYDDNNDTHPSDPWLWDDWDLDGYNSDSDSHPDDGNLWDDWNDNGINDSEEDPGGPDDDADGDGYDDLGDTHPWDPWLWDDYDEDGYNSDSDSHPWDPNLWDDWNGNGFNDADMDGTPDLEDSHPYDAAFWDDWNYNGISDELEYDSDNDGVADVMDSNPNDSALWSDWDDDGLNEEDEATYGTNPYVWDTDDDGLSDGEEVVHKTNPLVIDSDGDGLTDFEELTTYSQAINGRNLNPNNPYSVSYLYFDSLMVNATDTDGDGIPDAIESFYSPALDPNNPSDALGDLDADGITNVQEYINGTSLAGNLVAYDYDRDGITDIQEDFWSSRYPGILDKYSFDDSVQDPDADGVLNFEEVMYGLNPNDATTHEELADLQWINLNQGKLWSLPLLAGDTDGDGMTDLWEHRYGLDVRSAGDAAQDEEPDGLINLTEFRFGTSPRLVNTSEGSSDGNSFLDQEVPVDSVTGANTTYVPPMPGTSLDSGANFRNFQLEDINGSPEDAVDSSEFTFEWHINTKWYDKLGSFVNDSEFSGHMMLDGEDLVTESFVASREPDPNAFDGTPWIPGGVASCGSCPDEEGATGGCECEASTEVQQVDENGIPVVDEFGNPVMDFVPGSCGCGPYPEVPAVPPEQFYREQLKLAISVEPGVPEEAAEPLDFDFVLEQQGAEGWTVLGEQFTLSIEPGESYVEHTTDFVPWEKEWRLRRVDEGSPQDMTGSLSVSDMTGPTYRKVALNGLPISDRKPQDQDESGEQPEETYIDAYTRQLRHSVTDVYASIDSSLLPMTVRRDVTADVYSNTSGLRPSETPGLPFGIGWRSSLSSYVTITDRKKASVIDESGTSQRYVRFMKSWQRDYEENADAKTIYDRLIENSEGQLVLSKRFGNTCTYEMIPTYQLLSADRLNGSNQTDKLEYARLVSVKDRLGNQLNYVYPNSTALTPSLIYDTKRASQKIYIRQNDSLVTEVSAPDRSITRYHYADARDVASPVAIDPEFQGVIPLLVGVSHAGSETPLEDACTGGMVTSTLTGDDKRADIYSQLPEGSVRYYYSTLREADSNHQTGIQTFHTHFNLAGIEDESWTANSAGNKYMFDHEFNASMEYYQYGEGGGWKTQHGLPMLVSNVTLPDAQTVSFGGFRSVKVSTSAVEIGTSSIVTLVQGPAGNYQYQFSQPEILRPLGDPNMKAASGYVVYMGFKRMQITTLPATGAVTPEELISKTEIFTFNPQVNMALSSVTDMSGKTTRFEYDATMEHYWVNPSAPIYNADPAREINALDKIKHFEYGPYNQLSYVKDERGIRRSYSFDTLGRRTAEKLYGSAGQPDKITDFAYEDANFTGFVTRTTVRAPGSTQPEKIIYHFPDADGREAYTAIRDLTGGVEDYLVWTETAYDANGRKRSVRDGRDLVTLFQYDDRGRLKKVIHPDSAEKELFYDAHGNLVKEKNENGVFTFHAYDAFNRRVSSTLDMNGNGVADTAYTQMLLPEQEEGVPTFDGDIVTVTAYTDRNQIESVTDSRGKVTLNKYDNLGRLLETDDGGFKTKFTYGGLFGGSVFDSSSFKPATVTDARNVTTTFVYDDLYRVLRKSVSGVAGEVVTVYDETGNPTSVTDPLNRTTSYVYDSEGKVLTTTHADLTTTQAFYTTGGQPWKTVNELNATTLIYYDGAGRPVKTVMPAVNGTSGITETFYDTAGNVVKVKDPLGRATVTEYDARNRPVKVTAPRVWDAMTGQFTRPVMETEYDDLGQVVLQRDPQGAETRTFYDPAGRAWKKVNAAGHAIFSVYDATNNVLQVTEKVTGAGGQLVDRTVTNEYDSHNRLTASVDGENIRNEFGYDESGNRTLVKDGLNQETHFAYDSLNRLTVQTFKKNLADAEDDDTWTFGYDSVHKTSQTDPAGVVTTYGYDARSRLETVAVSGTLMRTYDYDAGGRLESVTEAQQPEANVAYAYDALGRVTAETSRGATHTYHYDLCGNRVWAELGTGVNVRTAFDTLNRPELILESDAGIEGSSLESRLTQYGYDLAGRAVLLIGANGQVTQNDYDVLGRLNNRTLFRRMNDLTETGVLAEFGWSYNEAGNVTAQHETWPGSPDRPAGVRTTEMEYDLANRLTKEVINDSGSGMVTTVYAYDAANNRTAKTVTGGTDPGHWVYHYNEGNQLEDWTRRPYPGGMLLKSAALEYDPNGNRERETRLTYPVNDEYATLTQQGITYQAVIEGEEGEDLSVSLLAGMAGQPLTATLEGGHVMVNLATDSGVPDTLVNQGITYATPTAHIPGHQVAVSLVAAEPDQSPGVSVAGNDIVVTLETDSGDKAAAVDQGINYEAHEAGPQGNDLAVRLERAAPNQASSTSVEDDTVIVKLETDDGVIDTLVDQGITYSTTTAREPGEEVFITLDAETSEQELGLEAAGQNIRVFLETGVGGKAAATDQGITYEAKVAGKGGNNIHVEGFLINPDSGMPNELAAGASGNNVWVALPNENGSRASLELPGFIYEAVNHEAEANDIVIAQTLQPPGEETEVSVAGDHITVAVGRSPGDPATLGLSGITFTAVEPGPGGNDIMISMSSSADIQEVQVTRSGTHIDAVVPVEVDEFDNPTALVTNSDVAGAIDSACYDLVSSDGGDGSPAEFSVSGQLSGGGENPVVAGAWEVYDKLSILYPQMAERLYIYDSGSQAGAGSGQLSGGVDPVVTATVQEVFDILDETAGLPVNVTLGGSGAALMQPSSFHLNDGGTGCEILSTADDVVALLNAVGNPVEDLLSVSGSGSTPLQDLPPTELTGGRPRASIVTRQELLALLSPHASLLAATSSGNSADIIHPAEVPLTGGGENFNVLTDVDGVAGLVSAPGSPASQLVTVSGSGSSTVAGMPRSVLGGGRVHHVLSTADDVIALLSNASGITQAITVTGGGTAILSPMAQTHLGGITPPASSITEYQWNSENRLTGVDRSDGKSYGYTYDYRMRRVATQAAENGQVSHTAILFSGGLSTAEYESSTVQATIANPESGVVEYVRGPDMGGGVGGLLYTVRSETGGGQKIRYNLSNGRGDIVAQSDSNALITWTASYEAYGKRPVETGSNQDKQRANSKDEDPTGLLNEGFRYRDIETGMFISRDPAGFVDGPNLYAYVQQNPWTSFDPLGLDDENAGKTIAKAQQEKVDFVRSMGHDDIADAQQGLLDNGKSMANSTAQAMDAVVSMTPIGTANEVIFGENSMGEPLTWDERGMSAITAIPGGKYLDKLNDILGAAKATAGKTDEMVEAVLKNGDTGAANSAVPQVLQNQAAGNAARDAIAATRPGSLIEQNFRVTGGLRRVDVLDGVTAIESKVGKTSLSSVVRQELARDVKMMRSGQVDSVEWHFSPSLKTGRSGPTGPLRAKLNKFAIPIVE